MRFGNQVLLVLFFYSIIILKIIYHLNLCLSYKS